MSHRILTLPDDADLLRRKAKRVRNPQDVKLEVQAMKEAARMWETLNDDRCEGLAATQIGINLRIIIVRASNEMAPPNPDYKAWNVSDDGVVEPAYHAARALYQDWARNAASTYNPWVVMINPQLLSSEGFQQCEGEGCLSVPSRYGTTVRPERLTFKYTRSDGSRTPVQVTVNPKAAQVLTHEFDHLNGVLYCDNALSMHGKSDLAVARQVMADDREALKELALHD